MKSLNQYIKESILDDQDKIVNQKYVYFPKTINKLVEIYNKLVNETELGGTVNLNLIDISALDSIAGAFFSINNPAYPIDKTIDVSNWDVSKYTNLTLLFAKCPYKIKGLENWDVSNVENMTSMFSNSKNFNGEGLEKWDVSNVKDMSYMFDGCNIFDGKSIENWNTSKVRNTRFMFANCHNFNGDISNWDVSNVEDMYKMFYHCNNFKQNLDNWKIKNDVDTELMFTGTKVRNTPDWYKK